MHQLIWDTPDFRMVQCDSKREIPEHVARAKAEGWTTQPEVTEIDADGKALVWHSATKRAVKEVFPTAAAEAIIEDAGFRRLVDVVRVRGRAWDYGPLDLLNTIPACVRDSAHTAPAPAAVLAAAVRDLVEPPDTGAPNAH